MQLRVKQNTVFKQYTTDSSRLAPRDKVEVPAGRMFEVHSWKPVGKFHWKVALINRFLGDPPRNTWYVFAPHVQLVSQRGQTPTMEQPPTPTVRPLWGLPSTKQLNIPHRTQLDNALNPKGACNVTCFAMVMQYFQIPQKTSAMQLEDELYRYMEAKGLSRHEPGDLAEMAAAYGLKNELTLRGSLADIRKAIAEGKPCIIHGYFTSFGHIIVVRGYDRSGFRVNDPFGEWTSRGYHQGPYGNNLHYSNNLIQSKCSPEGSDYIWLHRLSIAK
ncbi:C39 family peptidase [Alkalinema sp. FACHB-956]|uniref:C39 family peptidase n=1 Tax=Alkalinema sp. FACHB-956 TaxID=2692768 RepID=UPI0016880FF9|nr:C39 family peptidase [Alkalinema sp. FACHB-956]MBD2329800.1 C39 family peptidase [Alkalinema sp. FACHB-956]